LKNYWFIGDIHGEIRLLEILLDHVLGFKPDQLVFVGDYIDRGAHSRKVVDLIMKLDIPVASLMGNHELMMLNAMEDPGYGHSPVELWYYNGGEATLLSFGASSFFSFQSQLENRYLEFFRNLRMNHIIFLNKGLKLIGTHAGISPAIPLTDQLEMQDYRALNRYMLEKHIDPGDSFLWIRDAFFHLPSKLFEGYLVVHGHTPILKLKRMVSANGMKNFHFVENDICIRKEEETGKLLSIDIDSGSVISGRLTGLGFFVEEQGTWSTSVRLRSLTVSAEDIFPRDLGSIAL